MALVSSVVFAGMTACSPSEQRGTTAGVFEPSEIIDLGALVTQDLPERVWGVSLLNDNGFVDQNSFNVIMWEQVLSGATPYSIMAVPM